MPVFSSYDLWKTDPDPYGRQEAWEAAQQAAEDESLSESINYFDSQAPAGRAALGAQHD